MLNKSLIRGAKAVAKSAMKMERKEMRCIRIENGWAVFTDGHVLVAEPTEDPDGWVDPTALKATDASVGRNGSGLLVQQKNVTTHHEDRDDGFPNWAQVMPAGLLDGTPDPPYTLMAGFNPEVLIRALSAFESGADNPVKVWIKAEDSGTHPFPMQYPSRSAIVITQGERVALVMPVTIRD